LPQKHGNTEKKNQLYLSVQSVANKKFPQEINILLLAKNIATEAQKRSK
jgi:hypothetical protein